MLRLRSVALRLRNGGCSNYSSSKNTKTAVTKANKKSKSKSGEEASPASAGDHDASFDEGARASRLAAEENNPSLNVGPNGVPLFTSTSTLSLLSRKDVNTYFQFRREDLERVLPEGLPAGLQEEFQESLRSAVLVRQGFLDLRDNFRRVVDPPLYSKPKGPKVRKQIVLDGPRCCGKSIALSMLVHWARDEGWMVLYAPKGREWARRGFFHKNPDTGLWDTPLHAEDILKDFRKGNESRLKKLPCQIHDPIPLGEGAGVGLMKGVDSMTMPHGSTLDDLVKTGIDHTQAAVGVLVRLRKELSLVKDIPILIAIDQVNAFRGMMHDDMMVGAFSHSTAVGKLRKDLPDVPIDARVMFRRYSLGEAAAVSHYYLRQWLVSREAFSEENWKVYYLANGNGAEMRWLVPLMRRFNQEPDVVTVGLVAGAGVILYYYSVRWLTRLSFISLSQFMVFFSPPKCEILLKLV